MSATLVYLTYVAAWAILIIVLLRRENPIAALFTFGTPFIITPAVRWLPGALAFTRHIPFFIPLALLLVLLPLLTEDPWRLAAAAGNRIAILAAIAATPLVLLIVVRIVRLDLGEVLESAVDGAVEQALDLRATVREIDKSRDTSRELPLDPEATSSILSAAYTDGKAGDRMGEITVMMYRRYRWIALRHFLRLLVAVAVSIFIFIYSLAWAAMPPSLAAEWSKMEIRFQEVDIFGGVIELPLGPYLVVSILLAAIACVGFLGFATTEDRYSEALWNAVAIRPARELFILGIPYLALREQESDASAE
jgi:hypothetical protein